MVKWLLVGHCLVVGALAASEAQLKFVPVPLEKRQGGIKDAPELIKVSTAGSSTASIIPIANSSIRVNHHDLTQQQQHRFTSSLHPQSSHDPGRLHVAESYHHASRGSGRENQRYPQEYQNQYPEEHSRNFRGLQTPRVDIDLHGSHYPGPSYSGHNNQANGYRENRVEVRIDDYRRDQSAQGFRSSNQGYYGNSQIQNYNPQSQQRQYDRNIGGRDLDWQQDSTAYRRPQNNFQQNPYNDRRDEQSQQDFRPDNAAGSQSCGPQSPCLEPNGIFPADGNCCGFVNCANCRPYTQRCAAGTVFDLDLWICNHERDTRQCPGNNRECAYEVLNFRGSQSNDYDGNQRNDQRSNGWEEYASSSEIKEVRRPSGKAPRVKKIASRVNKKA